MPYFVEYGYTSLNHFGEELCGDKVEYTFTNNYLTLVLADGLGSGVKANILSTLTSKILCTMVANDVSINECLETIVASLPVCKVRGVAYSTFSVIHINNEGKGYLFEFDNPEAIYIHEGKCQNLPRIEHDILGKKVYESPLALVDGDYVLVMSDGTIHAGIGETLNFGWERKDIMAYLDKIYKPDMSARAIALELAKSCNDLYLNKPGDDTTVAGIRFRKVLRANIMVGPPVDKEKDDFFVKEFISDCDKTIVCGGTSSNIVARYLNEPVKVNLDYLDLDVPPTASIDGIDLVTEGVVTLRKLLELSEKYLSPKDLNSKQFHKKDGASLLANMLFEEATDIHFFVGQSVNPAHTGLPIDTTMKLKLVESLAKNLERMGKRVTLDYD